MALWTENVLVSVDGQDRNYMLRSNMAPEARTEDPCPFLIPMDTRETSPLDMAMMEEICSSLMGLLQNIDE